MTTPRERAVVAATRFMYACMDKRLRDAANALLDFAASEAERACEDAVKHARADAFIGLSGHAAELRAATEKK